MKLKLSLAMEAAVDTNLVATPGVEAVDIKVVEVDMVEVRVKHSRSHEAMYTDKQNKRRLRWWRATTGWWRPLVVIACADAILLSPISRIRTEWCRQEKFLGLQRKLIVWRTLNIILGWSMG